MMVGLVICLRQSSDGVLFGVGSAFDGVYSVVVGPWDRVRVCDDSPRVETLLALDILGDLSHHPAKLIIA